MALAVVDVRALWLQYGRKFARYCGVSAFNVVFGQSLLFGFHTVLGWPGWYANFAAVAVSSIPAYLLSRRWVWRQQGRHSLAAEVVPFWMMSFLGLVISTIAVALVDRRFDGALPVQLANIGSFGLVWVFKFVVLDRVMWRHPTSDVERPLA